MKKRFVLQTTLLAALCAALFSARAPIAEAQVSSQVATRDAVATEQRLPPKVYVYVSIPSVEKLKARWNRSQYGRLMNDESLAEFRRELATQFEKASKGVDQELGLSLEDLLSIPTGEASFAVLQRSEGKFGAVGLLDFGDSRTEVDRLLEKAHEALDKEGAKRKTTDFEGTRIVTYAMPKDEDDDGTEQKAGGITENMGFTYFVKGSHIAVGTDVATLESVLARWDGRHEQTFADNDFHRYIQSRCTSEGGAPVATWFLDPIGLLQAALTSGGEANLQTAMVLGYLPALGLDKLKAIGGAMELVTTEFDAVSRTFIYVDAPATGLLNVFRFPATDLTPPKWVSADVTGYSAFNWDVEGAYDAVEKLVDSISSAPGTFQQIVDSVPNRPNAPNVHPKKDIVDQLTGRIHVVSDFVDPDDVESARILVAAEIKDAAKMKGVLDKLAKSEGFPGTTRDFRGETIYEIEQPNPSGGDPIRMAIGVAEKHLMFVTNVTLLEQVLRGDKDRQPLAESESYKRVASHIPDQTSTLGYSRTAAGLQGVYKKLRSGDLGQEVREIDFSTLPPFEELKGYFGEAGSYTVPDRNGALAVEFSLKAEK